MPRKRAKAADDPILAPPATDEPILAAEDLDEADDRLEGDLSEEERDFNGWLASAPDFVRSAYPFDLPPYRMPFAKAVFTLAGAPEHCPAPACRRSGQCRGGEGPPCFRADRKNLQQVLFLWWLRIEEAIDEDGYWDALAALGNRYAIPRREEPRGQSPRR